MKPQERVLDLALREVIGGETPPDKADSILKATHRPRLLRGARGERPRWVIGVAAAVVLIASMTTLLWPDGGTSPTPEPTAEAWPRDGATGKAIPVPLEQVGPLHVRYDVKADVVLEEGARAMIRKNDVTLLGGRAAVRGPLRVTTARGIAVFEDGSEGEIALESDELLVQIEIGTARVGDRTIGSGEMLRLPEKKPEPKPPVKDDTPAPPDPLTPRQKEELDRLLMSIPIPDDIDNQDLRMQAMKAAVEMQYYMRAPGAPREYARPKLLAMLPSAGKGVEVRVLELLVLDSAARAPVVTAMDADATRFGIDTVLLLAEAGAASAHAEVVRRAAATRDTLNGVRPAAYLALRKDARGRATLRWFMRSRLTGQNPDLYFAAAAGLRALGDSGWSNALGFARRRMEQQLAKEELYQAASGLLRVDYFARKSGIRLAYYFDELRDWADARVREFDTAEKIRALFTDLEKR